MKWGWIQEKVQKLLPEPKWNQFLSSSDFSHILHDIKIRIWPNLFSATHGSRISKVNVDNCNVLLKGIVSIGSFLWSFVWKTNSFFYIRLPEHWMRAAPSLPYLHWCSISSWGQEYSWHSPACYWGHRIF